LTQCGRENKIFGMGGRENNPPFKGFMLRTESME